MVILSVTIPANHRGSGMLAPFFIDVHFRCERVVLSGPSFKPNALFKCFSVGCKINQTGAVVLLRAMGDIAESLN